MSSFLDRVKKAEEDKSKPGNPHQQPSDNNEEAKDKVGALPPPPPVVTNLSKFANPSAFSAPGPISGPSLFGSGAPKPAPVGFTPLPWSEFFDTREMINDATPLYIAGSKGPLILCMHGAGYSAMSFACLAKEMKGEFRLAAFDFRGHGGSKIPNETDHSVDTLIKDSIDVIQYIIAKFPTLSLIILGHSMGGSIAAKTVKFIQDNPEKYQWGSNIKALVVIDVVEGTAMDALPFMDDIVHSRPTFFKSVEAAIKWNISSGTIRNTLSSRVSIPPTIVEKEVPKKGKGFVWRTDLLKTKEFWEGWFKGLSKAFLDVRVPKMLVLAGNDRMDKELTIAQMQGKFKVEIVGEVGHVIQEDSPKKLAMSLKYFALAFKVHEDSHYVEIVSSLSGKGVVIGSQERKL